MREIQTLNHHAGECPGRVTFPVAQGGTLTRSGIHAVAMVAMFCVAQVAHGSITLLDFENSTVSSTLDQNGTGEIRWAEIVTVDNVSVDLVAKVSGPVGEYYSYNLSGNGGWQVARTSCLISSKIFDSWLLSWLDSSHWTTKENNTHHIIFI